MLSDNIKQSLSATREDAIKAYRALLTSDTTDITDADAIFGLLNSLGLSVDDLAYDERAINTIRDAMRALPSDEEIAIASAASQKARAEHEEAFRQLEEQAAAMGRAMDKEGVLYERRRSCRRIIETAKAATHRIYGDWDKVTKPKQATPPPPISQHDATKRIHADPAFNIDQNFLG